VEVERKKSGAIPLLISLIVLCALAGAYYYKSTQPAVTPPAKTPSEPMARVIEPPKPAVTLPAQPPPETAPETPPATTPQEADEPPRPVEKPPVRRTPAPVVASKVPTSVDVPVRSQPSGATVI